MDEEEVLDDPLEETGVEGASSDAAAIADEAVVAAALLEELPVPILLLWLVEGPLWIADSNQVSKNFIQQWAANPYTWEELLKVRDNRMQHFALQAKSSTSACKLETIKSQSLKIVKKVNICKVYIQKQKIAGRDTIPE